MARYNKRPSGLIVPSPIVSTASPTLRTGNNAPGFQRDPKSELFLLGVANFVGTDTFYEKGKVRDQRFVNLIHRVAAEDPGWLSRYLIWLRNESNMRTAAIIGAVEFCRVYKVPASAAVTAQDVGLPRLTMREVLQRADEPAEAIGYHLQTYGRSIPKSMKRGIADAAQRLYTEYATLKYDTASHSIRFGDVLELCHVPPGSFPQRDLFKHLIDRRHGREGLPDGLHMIFNNAELRRVAASNPQVLLASESLRAAGMTWEDALSLAGSKVPKKDLWEAMIQGGMGYMALLRNLRNFDEAGVSDQVAQQVIAKLTDPGQVARSRQLPMRFLSAYRHAPSLRWGYPLEQALQLSLRGVPSLPGRTLILVDQSPSMFPGYHFSTPNRSDISLADQAKIFGTALALRAEHADMIQYGGTSEPVLYTKAESLLKIIDRFRMIDSTNTAGTVRRWWNNGYDRIIVLTDEQANRHYGGSVFDQVVPATKMAITFNFAGYQAGHAESGSAYRVTIGGLSDQAFKLLPILEQRAAGQWPF